MTELLNSGHGGTYIMFNECGALLVEGLDKWIDTLTPISNSASGVIMKDSKNDSYYLIKKIAKEDL
jgi:hypothetical protein